MKNYSYQFKINESLTIIIFTKIGMFIVPIIIIILKK